MLINTVFVCFNIDTKIKNFAKLFQPTGLTVKHF